MKHRFTQRLATLLQNDTNIGIILCLLAPPLMLIDVYGGGFVLFLGVVLIIMVRLDGGLRPADQRPVNALRTSKDR
ncbi:hypothetical protein CKO42_08270 [Lamprobacter modestohalophilus]|uniref:Uncharacterized protein n=1 Tax=Lamprobacter modestohalophilus TaxID=1064514 RepID=A0A9X0W7W7_9GAMM|nr:hypothetical protein [Lamprobacter modestohalophilus]MBK1618431.1 hypothetical protein [Lamprobacter modestohalophilus]